MDMLFLYKFLPGLTGRFAEAKTHFKEALSSLATSKLNKEQKNNVRSDI
jgi:hypothetical protein